MDIQTQTVIMDLINGIDVLIKQSEVEEEYKEQARAILFYYVINPIITKDPDFFQGLTFSGGHSMTVEAKWAPFLIQVLKTGMDLFKAELEILPEAAKLEYTQDVPTPQELIDRFVMGLAGFYGIDHKNYITMRQQLINAIIQGVNHETLDVEEV